MAQCPNNWGVGSVFPTLENTYFNKGSEPGKINMMIMIIRMIVNYDHYHIHDDYDDHDDSIEIIGCNL